MLLSNNKHAPATVSMSNRIPFDLQTLHTEAGTCFICEFLKGNPNYTHFDIARTQQAVAFMNKFPTLEGYVLVAPLDHREQVTGDSTLAEYLNIQEFIYQVAEAVRFVLQPERVYILSLGSQSANAHVHWHIAPLPAGVPLEAQQYNALMHENGVVETDDAQLADLARRIRSAIPAHLSPTQDSPQN